MCYYISATENSLMWQFLRLRLFRASVCAHILGSESSVAELQIKGICLKCTTLMQFNKMYLECNLGSILKRLWKVCI